MIIIKMINVFFFKYFYNNIKLKKNFVIGEMSVFYLFTRFRFNWNEIEFSIFSTYNMMTGLIGMYLPVILKCNKIKCYIENCN